ncbi:MAG: hypothetical protein K2J73_04855 [Oscillospiraceae bacterium]|nr:hypothetical protein [Oscillospiraceae bacterium]
MKKRFKLLAVPIAAIMVFMCGCEKQAEVPEPDVITVDGISFSAFDSVESIEAVLGDKFTFDFTNESGDWLCGCLNIDTAVFFLPNYDGDSAAFEMYNGLDGASGEEEIERVLGNDCIKVIDDEGVHFLEAFINKNEIDYSQISVSGNWDEVFDIVYDYCQETSKENDNILLYCFNCNTDGSPDHIIDVYFHISE